METHTIDRLVDANGNEFVFSDSSKAEAGTASPLMDGKASVGNSLKYAREDHVHPSDASRASASHTHGSITNDGKIGSTADLAVVTGTSGAVTTADLTTASPTVPTGGTTTSLEFIDTVDQDSKGKISATKKAVTVDSTYSSTGTNPVNGKAIAAAIGGLDSNKTSTDGVNVQVKVTETDGKISAVNVTTDNTENKNNKVSKWQTTPDNTHYPSEKLVKDAINEKADLTKSVAIFDGYMRRMNEVPGWRILAYKQFNFTNTNLNALFRLYLFGSNNEHIGLGDLIVNIRFNASGSAPEFNTCYLMAHKPFYTSVKVRVIGVAGNAVVELWFKPLTFSMLTLTCLGNGLDVSTRTNDWTFGRYLSSTDPEPVEDTANHVYVFSGTVRSVQLNIASPTNDNLVAMDANGLVKESGLAKSSVESAIRKAGSAIQGVKVNNTTLTPDANKIVNVPLVTTSADGAMSAADKTKLDGIAAGTASPLMDGKTSVGNSLKYAREDHVHPSDTSREDIANKTTVVLGTSDSKYPTDKAVAEFVNSSIATNTANYISNNGEPFTSVEQLEAYSGSVTNNDYAFVTGIDSEGNTYYDRYKATVKGSSVTWALEYRLNNSSFTAAQWSAINSGITSALVAKIHTHSNKAVLDGITSSDVANWNDKLNVDGYNATNEGVTLMMRRVSSGSEDLSDDSQYFGDSNADHTQIVRRPITDIWNYIKKNVKNQLLGSVGSKDKPIYLENGVPKVCDDGVPFSSVNYGGSAGYGVFVGGAHNLAKTTRCNCTFLISVSSNPDLMLHTYLGTFSFRGDLSNKVNKKELKCLTGTPAYPLRIAVVYNEDGKDSNGNPTYTVGLYVIPADKTYMYSTYRLTRIAYSGFIWDVKKISEAEYDGCNSVAKQALRPIILTWDAAGSNVTKTGGTWLPTFDKATKIDCRGIVDMSIQVDLSIIGQTTYIDTISSYEITLVNSSKTDILNVSLHQTGRMPRQTKSSTSGGTIDISHTHRFIFPISSTTNLIDGYMPKITLPSSYTLDTGAQVSIKALCRGIVLPYGADEPF